MSTSTTTETSQPPELSIFNRVGRIPLIASSIEAVNGTLSNNQYTRSPYATALGLSNTAYKYTEPIQAQLAPYLVRADGLANKAVDVVESRYPAAFTATPEDVLSYVRETQQSYSNYVRARRESASKAIDEKVKSPALSVAQGIDHKFAPIVDYFEVAVNRLNSNPSSPSASNGSSQYQYQRAIILSKSLADQLQVFSSEQVKQLQAHSALVQRASETAASITATTSASIASAQSRVHALSDTMLTELQKLQSQAAALSSSLQSSASATIHDSQVQKTYSDLSAILSSTAGDLRSILAAKDLTLQEKALRAGNEVRDRVTPLLETLKQNVSVMLSRGRSSSASSHPTTNGVNGNVHTS